ncbi:hypothetical protein V6N13_099416 [Hibiscus sabdariffa]
MRYVNLTDCKWHDQENGSGYGACMGDHELLDCNVIIGVEVFIGRSCQELGKAYEPICRQDIRDDHLLSTRLAHLSQHLIPIPLSLLHYSIKIAAGVDDNHNKEQETNFMIPTKKLIHTSRHQQITYKMPAINSNSKHENHIN